MGEGKLDLFLLSFESPLELLDPDEFLELELLDTLSFTRFRDFFDSLCLMSLRVDSSCLRFLSKFSELRLRDRLCDPLSFRDFDDFDDFFASGDLEVLRSLDR